MDDRTFDSLVKLSVTSAGRRRLLQAAMAAGFGGLLTRGGAEAEGDVGAEACQSLQSKCNRNRQCQCHDRRNVICDPLPSQCRRTGTRCCGTAKAKCKKDCDCCKGYQCNKNKGECKNK